MSWQDLDKAWNTVEPAAEAGSWKLVPDGTDCHLVVVDQKPHTKKKKEVTSYSVEVVFEVVEPKEYAGVRIWRYFGLGQENLAYLKRDFTLLGWKGDKISALMNTDDSTLIGLGCLAVVGLEKSSYADATTGETKEKTKNVIKVIREGWKMPPSSAAPASHDDGPESPDGFKPPF